MRYFFIKFISILVTPVVEYILFISPIWCIYKIFLTHFNTNRNIKGESRGNVQTIFTHIIHNRVAYIYRLVGSLPYTYHNWFTHCFVKCLLHVHESFNRVIVKNCLLICFRPFLRLVNYLNFFLLYITGFVFIPKLQ